MTDWMTYWRTETVDWERAHGGPIRHLGSEQFVSRGVAPGDRMFVVNWSGRLRIIGRLTVDLVTDQAGAVSALGTADVWDATDHVIATPSTASPVRTNAWLTEAQMQRLEFIGPTGTVGPKLNRHGKVDHQAFRTTREVTAASAQLLDSIYQRAANRP